MKSSTAMRFGRAAAPLLLGAAALAQATARAVDVPNVPTLGNANASIALPGFPEPARLQVLVDPQQLQGAIGQTITGLRFRRQAHQRPFLAANALWTVQLSIAPHAAIAAQSSFAANAGVVATTPLMPVAAPASPGLTTAVPWDAANTITVPTPPLPYTGGTLCIEIFGRPDPNLPNGDWPIDAIAMPRLGASMQQIGPGCGAYGNGTWSFVEPDTLLVGATTHFSAFGAPNGFCMLILNDSMAPFVYPLQILGGQPGCFLHVPNSIMTLLTPFSGPIDATAPALGGLAVIAVTIPVASNLVGATFASQWLDAGQQPFVASNGIAFTIANAPPNLGMTTIAASARFGPPTVGEIAPDFAPVLQILY